MLITPQYFSINPPSQQGQVYGTEFTFASQLPLEYTTFVWDFGDGYKSYNNSNPTHTFNYPGVYTIRLSAWTDYGLIFSEKATVDVDYVIRDRLVFSKLPETFNLPGILNSEPFVVSITSAKIDQPISVYLQSYYSKSLPHYAVPTKWRFLVPVWKFYDANRNLLDNNILQIPTEPIYNEESKIVAVKGEASFYYTDDIATGADIVNVCPLILGATLSTENFSYPKESIIYPYASYSNNETVRAIQAWQVTENLPTKLKVTENYINDVYSVKWANVPIPLMITTESDPLESGITMLQGEVRPTKNLAYPLSNELGKAFPVVISLSSNGTLPGVSLTQGIHFSAQRDNYFQVTDSDGNSTTGYVLGNLIPLSPALTAVAEGSTFVVTASTIAANTLGDTVAFGFPYGFIIRANTYVSHPYANVINKVSVTKYPKFCDIVNYFEDIGLLAQGSYFTYISTPALTSIDIKQETLSGCSAVYGMAYNPIKDLFYACDADSNMLRMYNSANEQISAINLAELFGTEKLAPSHISIDRLYNVWLSLFDDYRLVKFDYNLKYLLSAAPDFANTQDSSKKTSRDLSLAPPIVETDRKNHVWACWFVSQSGTNTIPMTSVLCHFDSLGRELKEDTIFLPSKSEPVSLAVSPGNSVWVACRGTDNIIEYNSISKTITTTITGVYKPSYISLDRSANVWITHGYDLCSVYNLFNKTLSTWQFTSYFNISSNSYELSSVYVESITPEMTAKAYKENEIWGGLNVDVYDRVWVVDSVRNTFCSFRNTDPSDIVSVPLAPKVTSMPVILGEDTFVSTVTGVNPRSAQAGGDWTGNRWYQKYAGVLARYPIYGQSAPFRLYDIDKSYQIAKVDETFNCADYFKSLALPEILNRNTELFDVLFTAVAGDSNPTKESAGRIIYEKIANFINNHADLDTAEINQLASFATQVNVETKTFGNNFPVAVNRLINLFSIPKHNLRGIPKLAEDIADNIGTFITNGDSISADNFYYIKDKDYGDAYIIQATPTAEGIRVFPLEEFEIAGLRSPLWENYYVYTYTNESYVDYTGNIIDWTSPYTTVSYNLSGEEDWYGDGGLVETMFNNLLTKQLYLE